MPQGWEDGGDKATHPQPHSIGGGVGVVGAHKMAAEDSASTLVYATYQIILTTQEVD